ncbi:MAG TPA: indole-3-glycerol phosphate synthase TrpC [Chloroflexi bacterium]|nr:indole-3-glycerol phosphate synthase TrpC [Chloroflexota bacterium]
MHSKTILDEIVHHKWGEVERLKRDYPLEAIQDAVTQAPPPRDFGDALRAPDVSLIAEVKKASPSKGVICEDFDPVALARAYEAHGAAAVSVLTDAHFFQGRLDDLRAVRQAVEVPVLRKDFVIDPYQVYEARAAGADAVLLIVAALDDARLLELHRLVRDLGMTALVEVHDGRELERALVVGPRVVGVNNRDLRTFEVSLETTARLRAAIPVDVVLVSESGVHTPEDVARLAEIGAHAMLVGEALVRADDVGAKIQQLLGDSLPDISGSRVARMDK